MRLAIAIGLTALVAQAGLLATPAFAATITVNTTADEKPGVDPPDGDCSLREALQAAHDDISWDACNAGSGADTVILPAGTYNVSASRGEVTVQDSQVTIDGAGEGSTIVDGGAARTVFWTIGSPPIRIQDLTVRNGLNTVGAGGVMNLGTLTLDHVTVTGSDAGIGGLGGGVANSNLLTVTDSTITVNAGEGIHDQGTLTLTNSTVSDNSTSSGGAAGGVETHDATIGGSTISGNSGKGIYALGSIDVSNTTVSGNTGRPGDFGAGISLLIQSGTASSTLDHVRVTGNTAPSDGGDGGVSNLADASAASNLTILDSTIAGNHAPSGGGIDNGPGNGSATIERSTISGNAATTSSGGGIVNNGPLTLTASTVSGNTSDGNGAGIQNGGPLTIRSSTIANNSSTNGTGGIQGTGPISVGNTIVADNAGKPGLGDDCFAPLDSAGYNLIESFDPGQCPITGDTTGNISSIDPMLGTLQDNGGPTFTQAVAMDSPVVDQGNGFGKRIDQRGTGFPRPIDFTAIPNASGGDGSDIGAFEVQASPPDQPPVVLSIGDQAVQVTQALVFTVSATDVDGQPLTYAASHLPPGASFDPAAHRFSWTPGAGQEGSYPNVRFEVSDGVLSDVENVTIRVTSAPAPAPAPPATDQLAAAIQKCKSKYKGAAHKKQRKRCIKKAKKRFGVS